MFLLFLSTLNDCDRHFVEELFDRHKDKIYSIAYDILNNRHDAEDAVDEVMIKIIKNISKFFDKSCLEINRQIVIYTRSTAIDIYRKNKSRIKHETDLWISDLDGEFEEMDIPDMNCDVEMDYIHLCTSEMLIAAMNNMKPIYRDTIKLRVLMNYTYEEIAVALNISTDLARKRCERARKILQDLLNELM